MPGVRLPVFAGGRDESKESKLQEKMLVKLMRRVEVLEYRVEVLEGQVIGTPRAATPRHGLTPFATIPDGEEDCD